MSAVLDACRILVAITARSMAAVAEVGDLLELRALVVLSGQPPMSLGTLADAVGIHLTRASRLCDRLVARGLIDRTDDPGNRRQLLLQLTKEGHDVVAKVMQEREGQIRPILARMTPNERKGLVTALGPFAQAADGLARTDLWALGWSP
ncbi:MarR family transcriptional regulator [Terrabacter aeriphilus]|uniref:MarR family transcriptional regulator n=1 Tax=Terrabacter aeriphilus TaxID=515662 RepID=A0ABP9JET6_9MICO